MSLYIVLITMPPFIHHRLLQHSLVLDPRVDDSQGVGGGSADGGNGSFSGKNMDMVLEPELLPLSQSLTSVSWTNDAGVDGGGNGGSGGGDLVGEDGDGDARKVVWIDESWWSATESRSAASRGPTGYQPPRPLALTLTRDGVGFSIFSVDLPAHPNGSSILGEAVRCDCHSCELPTSADGLIDVSGAGAGEQDHTTMSSKYATSASLIPFIKTFV